MATTWTTRDGCELLITEMGTEHIANTIALIHRNAVKRLPLILLFTFTNVHQLLQQHNAKYRALCHELRRRAMRAMANARTLFLDGTAVRGMQMEMD